MKEATKIYSILAISLGILDELAFTSIKRNSQLSQHHFSIHKIILDTQLVDDIFNLQIDFGFLDWNEKIQGGNYWKHHEETTTEETHKSPCSLPYRIHFGCLRP